MGILLTNAFESYQGQHKEQGVIGLVLTENEDNLTIAIENQAKEMLVREIEAIFNKGYSSKGKNRGLGLARVKQLTMQVKADLIVMNQVKENENWVCFKVVIPKWKDE